MRELAMRAVGGPPLLEQRQDLGGLLIEQPVHRQPARRLVGQLPGRAAGDPAVRADLTKFQFVAGPPQRPAALDRGVEQLQQPCLGGRVHPQRDPATQPQRPFPRPASASRPSP